MLDCRPNQNAPRLKSAPFWLASLALTVSSGCSGFWDEVTSQDFKVKSLFEKPNPFLVLHDSADGDKRAQAFHALREPKQHGGSDQDQDAVVKILVTAASNEKQFLCRVAAVESLGQFKDPRAVTGLTDAFYNSGTFTPELSTKLQCMVLASLGSTHNPTAVPLLVRVMKGAPAEGTDQEKQQVMDVRIAAAHALSNFDNYAAAEGLVQILQKEKDVALCDAAFESLQVASGRKLPSDFGDWDDLLKQAKARDADPNHGKSSGIHLAAWFR